MAYYNTTLLTSHPLGGLELSITSPRMITSPDFALAFDGYRKMRDEITAVVNNLELLEERAKALMSQEDLVLLELHKTALLRAKHK